MTFYIIGAVLSVVIAGWIGFHFIRHNPRLVGCAKWGAAFTGSGALLAGADLVFLVSPFDGWASVLFRIGVLLILADWLRIKGKFPSDQAEAARSLESRRRIS